MLAVIGVLVCIIAGIKATRSGAISPDTFYIVISIFVTGLLIRGENKGKEKEHENQNYRN